MFDMKEIYETIFNEIDIFVEKLAEDIEMFDDIAGDFEEKELLEAVKLKKQALTNIVKQMEEIKFSLKMIGFQNHNLRLFSTKEQEEIDGLDEMISEALGIKDDENGNVN